MCIQVNRLMAGKLPPHPILIVEDDAGLRRAMSLALEDAGYAVAGAADGEAALEWLEVNQASLIVTDLVMPRLDGVTLLDRLRVDHRGTPVILVSGRSLHRDPGSLGATDYIRKPVDLDDMLSRIAEALALS